MAKALNLLRLDQIRLDGGTQSRVTMSQPTIADYAELLTDGVKMPPVIVYHDGVDFWLAAGFHRYHAHKHVGMVDIDCEVRAGSLDEARLCGARDNNPHGLAPTNGDKTKSVTMALANPLCTDWSERKLAKELGVSHTLVQRVKASLVPAPAAEVATVATAPATADPVATVATAAAPAGVATVATQPPAEDPEPAPAARTVPAAATTPPETPADEHDGEMATQAELLEQTQGEVEALQAQLTAATADDKSAEIVKWRKAYDHANRQFSEAQDRAKDAADREAWTMRQLRRCGKAIGQDDPKNIAPAVEALCRKVKVTA